MTRYQYCYYRTIIMKMHLTIRDLHELWQQLNCKAYSAKSVDKPREDDLKKPTAAACVERSL